MRFKKQLGATLVPVPYSLFPSAHGLASAESLTGTSRVAAEIIKRVPISVARVLGGVLYGYLA